MYSRPAHLDLINRSEVVGTCQSTMLWYALIMAWACRYYWRCCPTVMLAMLGFIIRALLAQCLVRDCFSAHCTPESRTLRLVESFAANEWLRTIKQLHNHIFQTRHPFKPIASMTPPSCPWPPWPPSHSFFPARCVMKPSGPEIMSSFDASA